ncbi:lysophospholipid acyltransferase family protein [Algirhabdus cladophorae]|uniref:lysophospholipid acyltransferase family protein n=1 Tax=Algirhabdus cladophorae TaxID=3377108 RepID=UPI003B845A2D
MPKSQHRNQTREISYAYSAQTRSGRAMIRVMENATGRLGLIRRAKGYEHDVAGGRDFFQVMADRYGLSLDIRGGALSNIPKEGPLIVVANHPYGILDGLMLGYILSVVRGDFRILAHRVFHLAEDLNRVILPISFDETKDAVKLNIQTRKDALNYLEKGGAMGVFPGGTVSTAVTPFAKPLDPGWRAFTAKMVAKSNATVVPIFFDGQTSRLFQMASHLHATLRMGFMIKEFKAKVDSPLPIVIGAPLPQSELDARRTDNKAMMEYLRTSTYALSTQPLDPREQGFEFEKRYKH